MDTTAVTSAKNIGYMPLRAPGTRLAYFDTLVNCTGVSHQPLIAVLLVCRAFLSAVQFKPIESKVRTEIDRRSGRQPIWFK